jgi:hypothetical protein
MKILKGTIKTKCIATLGKEQLISEETFYIEQIKKFPIKQWKLLSSFGIGYEIGDIFDWCEIKNQNIPIDNISWKEVVFTEVNSVGCEVIL